MIQETRRERWSNRALADCWSFGRQLGLLMLDKLLQNTAELDIFVQKCALACIIERRPHCWPFALHWAPDRAPVFPASRVASGLRESKKRIL